MTRGRHAAGGTFPRDLVITVVGIIVVGAIVFTLLWVGSSLTGGGDDAVVASSTTVTSIPAEAPASTAAGSESSTATTTIPQSSTTLDVVEARPTSDVVVQVLNAVGTTGLAAEVTATLQEAGYETVPPDDYEPLLSRSRVLFRDGYGPEAFELAALFPDAEVGQSPDVPDGVDILVLIGTTFEDE
ncbi:MAG: LytR C-terminal domain-containing protein [Acidimicrobiia bacterium]|nr:LytR C-terminal domain-containing protein [Acidimicrobiia bacterium]MDH5294372.1 LytR C-terminal domain-containing protein [Acidimicrobiia bacterium]